MGFDRMKLTKFDVIFCESSKVYTSPQPGQILIKHSSNWNDFGYYINATYKLYIPESDIWLEGELLVGFLPFSESESDLNVISTDKLEQIGSIDAALKYKRNGGKFIYFTHFPNLQEYRKIVISLGVKITETLLKSLNNVLLAENFSSTKGLYEKVLNSEVFSRAFMRKSESFFAFHNADSIIRGIEFENYAAISNSFSLDFKLDGFRNNHKIHFNFDAKALIPSRINVLIGKNGLGKSQALTKLCRALLKRKEPESTKTYTSDSLLAFPMINRLLALVSPGDTNLTFPGEYANRQTLFYRKIELTKSSGNNSLGRLFERLLRSENYINESYRIDIFKDALFNIIDLDTLYLNDDINGDFICIRNLYYLDGFTEQDLKIAEKIRKCKEVVVKSDDHYHPLSSGQKAFFDFALRCCLYIENGTLIVLDEPETHLHPNFIGEFVELLDYILEHTGSFAIIATHSPYLVREVGRKQVHIFSLDNNECIKISNPRLRTFGSDVESISQFVFNEDVENRLTDKIFKKRGEKSFEELVDELSDEVSLGAVMTLKSKFESDL